MTFLGPGLYAGRIGEFGWLRSTSFVFDVFEMRGEFEKEREDGLLEVAVAVG